MVLGGKKQKGKNFSREKQFTSETELAKESRMNYRNTTRPDSDSEEEQVKKPSNPAQAVLNMNRGENENADDEQEEEQEIAPPPLSRREREEIQKAQQKEHFLKMTMEGKTDQARADLARLAIIRKQREEAKLKREEAANAAKGKNEDSLAAGKSIISKTLGKKK
jgi:hypothetical protein